MKRFLICLSVALAYGVLVIALSGCAANFGTGELVFNAAGSQNGATGTAQIDNATATDGGLGQGAETDVSPLLPESAPDEQPSE
jgi:hypothetical protein